MPKHKENPQNKNKIDFSVVIPVYNSEETLKKLHKRLVDVFKKLGSSWELILVNDCSRDKSWGVIQEMMKSHKNILAVNLMNNFGQHNAVMCGLKYVKGNYVVTMDDDLQHPPEEIIKLNNRIRKGNFMVVYGQYKRKRHGRFRDFCSKAVNKILARITGSGYQVTSFRIMKQEVVKEIVKFKQYNAMIDVFIKNVVSSIYVGHCKVQHHSRTGGKSNYSFKRLFWFALNMIFNFTLWPLRLASILGFLFSVISILFALFFVYYYFAQDVTVSGWASLFVAITFVSGIILFVMGIVGEYLGRVFLNINQTPQYVVKEEIINRTNGD